MSGAIKHLMLVVISLLSSRAGAAVCLPDTDYSVAAEFKRSDYVAAVRITKVTWMDLDWHPTTLKPPLTFGTIPGGLDPYIGAYYTALPIIVYKGKLPRVFRIFSENNSGRTPLQPGAAYLVFLTRNAEDDFGTKAGDLEIDPCGNWDILPYPMDKLKGVQKLAARQRKAK